MKVHGKRKICAVLFVGLIVFVAFIVHGKNSARRDRFLELNNTIMVGMDRSEVLERFDRIGLNLQKGLVPFLLLPVWV